VPAAALPEPQFDYSGDASALVVEDNPSVSEVTVSMLEELGYQVQLVSSAQGALEALSHGDFDLVVSDIVMPGTMDGIALARAIRKRKPSTPIILVTGYASIADDPDLEFPLIRKPLRVADLSRALARLTAQT
jgi:CheY-like chemotaxis protein